MDDFCQHFYPPPETWKKKAPTADELVAYKARRSEQRREFRRKQRAERLAAAISEGNPIPARNSAAKRFMAGAEMAAAFLISTIRR